MKWLNFALLAALVPATAIADPNSPYPNRNPDQTQGPSQDEDQDQSGCPNQTQAQDQNQNEYQNPNSDTDTNGPSESSGRARLGVMVMSMTPDLRAFFGAPQNSGLLVAGVDPSSTAARAGVRAGDVITRVGDQRIQSISDVMTGIAHAQMPQAQQPGQQQPGTLTIEIIRDHKRMTLQARLMAHPPMQPRQQL